jgi:hypothetical protein
MIPVYYNGSNWVKADTTNIDGSWYNYDTQNWANAVTISNATTRATYVSAAVGTTINMSDINAMFVWIPRYSYTIGNTYGVQGYGGSTPSQATPGAIDIKFVSTSTTDTGTAIYTGSTASNYYTSPAFCWGDTCDSSRSDTGNTEISGLWTSKFKISAGSTNVCTTSPYIANCNLTSINPVVKPDVASWIDAQVSTFFTAIQTNMNSTNGTTNYGFSGSTYDTHMMKNTEWGAVAYLSQSKYGKYGNTTYSGAQKEIYRNNSSLTYTGRSEGTAPGTNSYSNNGTYTYLTSQGQGASTTGNTSGVYDMSGGVWEYAMGNMMISGNTAPMVGYNSASTSGFAGKLSDGTTASGVTFPSNKYYNKYNYGTTASDSVALARTITGDATREINVGSSAGWYNDYVDIVNSSSPWFVRGGHWEYSIKDGVFASSNIYGQASERYSSRIFLKP